MVMCFYSDNGQNTDIEISMKDVYEEFDALRKKAKIGQFFSKAVTRKYAFELPNIPVESDYLKVVYSFAGILC
jgi:DNA polymerase alpha subunit A